MFPIKYGSFKSFENGTVKLLAKETRWVSLEVRTQHTLLETLISKYDTGPVKLPGLSRNGPLRAYTRLGFLPKQTELNNTNIVQDDSVRCDTRVGSKNTELKEERKKLIVAKKSFILRLKDIRAGVFLILIS